jgi:hypothetical protein
LEEKRMMLELQSPSELLPFQHRMNRNIHREEEKESRPDNEGLTKGKN